MKFIKIFIFTIILITVTAKKCQDSVKKSLSLKKYHEAIGITSVQIKFKSFEDLNINCSSLIEEKIDILNLCPLNKNLLLNNDLDIRLLINAISFRDTNIKYKHESINNLKGFNLNINSKSTENIFEDLLIYE